MEVKCVNCNQGSGHFPLKRITTKGSPEAYYVHEGFCFEQFCRDLAEQQLFEQQKGLNANP